MDHLRARFYNHPRPNREESKEAGHAVFDDVVMVELSVIGAKSESISRVATDEHKAHFAIEWAEFNGEQVKESDATPLRMLEGFSPARVKEFEGLGIRSIQQLANVADGNIMKVREGMTLKQRAQKWIEAQRLAERDVTVGQVEELQARLDRLEAENAELAQNQRKKPGPKPKVEDDANAQAAV